MKRILLIIFAAVLSGCIKDNPKGADLKVGDRLPDFEVIMSDGSVVTDESLKGNVSVVVFFHTSCPDCRQALPVIQNIYDDYAPKNVVFAVVSREEGSDEVLSYWKENGLEMPYSAQNSRKVYEKFASVLIPRVYISDRDGIIRYIFTDEPVPSYDDVSSAIEALTR